MNENIKIVADYLAHAQYIFLCTVTVYDSNLPQKCRTIILANNFAEAMVIAEEQFRDEMEDIKLEILDTCFTVDEETFEKFRKDLMPIYTDDI